jgi:hypothetical protein
MVVRVDLIINTKNFEFLYFLDLRSKKSNKVIRIHT